MHVRERTNTHAKERIEGERERAHVCMHTSKPGIRTKTDPEVCYNWNGEEKKKSKDHKFFTSAIKHFTALSNQMVPGERF